MIFLQIPDELDRAIPGFRISLENPSLSRQEDLVGGVSSTKASEGRYGGTIRFANTDYSENGQLRQRLMDLFANVLDDPSNWTRLPMKREFVPTFDGTMITGLTVSDITFNTSDGAFYVGIGGLSGSLDSGIYVKCMYNGVPRITQVVKTVGGKHVFWPSLMLTVGSPISPADSIDAISRDSRSSTSGTINELGARRINDGLRWDFIERVKG